MHERSPCLTHSLPYGSYITIRGRQVSMIELARLKGLPPLSSSSVSPRGLGAMLGNSICVAVLRRIFGAIVEAVDWPLGLNCISLWFSFQKSQLRLFQIILRPWNPRTSLTVDLPYCHFLTNFSRLSRLGLIHSVAMLAVSLQVVCHCAGAFPRHSPAAVAQWIRLRALAAA
jgi:hypothetical protein